MWRTRYIDMIGHQRVIEHNEFIEALFILTDLLDHGYHLVSTNVQKFGGGRTLR